MNKDLEYLKERVERIEDELRWYRRFFMRLAFEKETPKKGPIPG